MVHFRITVSVGLPNCGIVGLAVSVGLSAGGVVRLAVSVGFSEHATKNKDNKISSVFIFTIQKDI